MNEEPSKILVIGAKVPGVKSVPWLEGTLPNIADYDVVIANGPALEDEMEKVPDEEELSDASYQHWNNRFETICERMRKLMKSRGEIYAIVGTAVARCTKSDPDNLIFPNFLIVWTGCLFQSPFRMNRGTRFASSTKSSNPI